MDHSLRFAPLRCQWCGHEWQHRILTGRRPKFCRGACRVAFHKASVAGLDPVEAHAASVARATRRKARKAHVEAIERAIRFEAARAEREAKRAAWPVEEQQRIPGVK